MGILSANTCRTAGLAALGLVAAAGSALAAYPERPVTFIVPWAAGGGTDTVMRLFNVGFEQAMGQPVNIVNRAGGNGVVGHSAIMNSTPDGYTVGACTSEVTTLRTIGLADIGPDDFDLISRIAMIPAGITVKAGGDYPDAAAFVEALKGAEVGELTDSGGSVGGAWHLAAAGLAKSLGLPADTIAYIPSQGGAPALQDLAAGGLDVFTGSPVEAQSLAEAGQVEVIAVMAEERLSSMPDVPTLKEATGLDWTFVNWFSLCAPKGLPEDVKAAITAAAEEAWNMPVVQDGLKQRGITPIWDGPEKFEVFASEFAATAKDLLSDLGLAKDAN